MLAFFVITAERYMAIRYPLKHLVIRKKRIQKVLVIVWSCSLLISFLPFKWISAIFPVYQPVSTYYLLGFTAFCLCLPSLYHTASCFSHLCIYSKLASPKRYPQAAFKGWSPVCTSPSSYTAYNFSPLPTTHLPSLSLSFFLNRLMNEWINEWKLSHVSKYLAVQLMGPWNIFIM